MTDLFDKLDAPTAKAEGGYVNNPNDRGGETNHGITIATARRNGYAGPMRDMTAAQAKAIRRGEYYVRSGAYLLAPISEAVATEVYDSGILHGPGTAAIWLQRCLNALNRGARDYADIPVDGGIGPRTAATLAAYLKRNGRQGELRMLKALNCIQGAYCIAITEAREQNEAFLNGWLDNRVIIPEAA